MIVRPDYLFRDYLRGAAGIPEALNTFSKQHAIVSPEKPLDGIPDADAPAQSRYAMDFYRRESGPAASSVSNSVSAP